MSASSGIIEFLDNPYVTGALTIGFVLYGALVAPPVSSGIKKVLQSPYFQIPFVALVAYRANHNPTVSLALALGFFLAMMSIQRDWFRSALRLSHRGIRNVKDAGGDLLDLSGDLAEGGYTLTKDGVLMAGDGAQRIVRLPIDAAKYMLNAGA